MFHCTLPHARTPSLPPARLQVEEGQLSEEQSALSNALQKTQHYHAEIGVACGPEQLWPC